MAGFCGAAGRFENSARFYGAAEAQARRCGLQRDRADAAFLMPRLEAARARLGDGFARARDEGGQWNREDALRRAVAELA